MTSRASTPAGTQGSAGPPDPGPPDGDRVRPADPWPSWARAQLLAAAEIADQVRAERQLATLATHLRRRWYTRELDGLAAVVSAPLGGLYRRAHAGSARPICSDGVSIVARNDVIGRDGWWRTWGPDWNPTTSRSSSIRILLTPSPSALAAFVNTLTAALIEAPIPWLLACTTEARRLRRAGSAVLYLADGAWRTEWADLLAPTLAPQTPPLCLPLAPGVAVSEDPGNGMSFAAHRCHLTALGLQRSHAHGETLAAIADVFAAHGIDPAQPHRSAKG